MPQTGCVSWVADDKRFATGVEHACRRRLGGITTVSHPVGRFGGVGPNYLTSPFVRRRDESEMNVVVIRGVLSREPEVRVLASGSTLVVMDVSTPTDDGVATVPVAWFDPRSEVTFGAGDEVVALGQVRRRFFRAGSVTQSRTELVATEVVRARQRRSVQRLLGVAQRLLQAADGTEGS